MLGKLSCGSSALPEHQSQILAPLTRDTEDTSCPGPVPLRTVASPGRLFSEIFQKLLSWGSRELAYWLRALVVLAENPG